jgi:uncharacterized membrane protein
MAIGPVQLLVVGFDKPDFTGEIAGELERLRESGVVRLVDLLVVRKDDDGNIESVHQSDLTPTEAAEFGAFAGALFGLGAAGEEGIAAGAEEAAAEVLAADGHVLSEEDFWYAEEAIPNGSAAAIALIEHHWAIGLRDAIARAGGVSLVDEWIHPIDLIAVGLASADEIVAG